MKAYWLAAIGLVAGCIGGVEDERQSGAVRADGGPSADGGVTKTVFEESPVCRVPGSGWCGPYNINGNNCHNAANCGVASGCSGILSCKDGVTSGLAHHTVNYSYMHGTFPCSTDPTRTCGQVCLSEPQTFRDGIDVDTDGQLGGDDFVPGVCCWEQPADLSRPTTAAGEPGRACYERRCGSQQSPGGGAALPPGEEWPTSVHHAAGCYYLHGGGDNTACGDCCEQQGAYWNSYFHAAGLSRAARERRRAERDEFLSKCHAHCRLPPDEQQPEVPVPDLPCAELRRSLAECRQGVLSTERNVGANHFCYAECSARYGTPHCNQVDMPCRTQDEFLTIYDDWYTCVLELGRAICDQWFAGQVVDGASLPYIGCFYDCMGEQADRVCGPIQCALDDCGDAPADPGTADGGTPDGGVPDAGP